MGNGPISEPELRRLLEHEAWIRRLARSLVADENRANELIQHVLTAALKNPPRNPKPWITVVMRAAAWRMRRSESRRKHRENAVARKEAEIPGVPHADQRETRERLVSLVQDMEPSYREVLILHFFEDLTLEEIAHRKGVPSATMRTRLRRALAQLREKLRAHYGDPSRWVFSLLPITGIRRLSDLGETSVAAKAKVASASGAKVVSTKAMLGMAAMVLSGSSAVLLVSLGSSKETPSAGPVVALEASAQPVSAAALRPVEGLVAPESSEFVASNAGSAASHTGSFAPIVQESTEDIAIPFDGPIQDGGIIPISTTDGSVTDFENGAIPIPPGSGGNWNNKSDDSSKMTINLPNQAKNPAKNSKNGKKGKKKSP